MSLSAIPKSQKSRDFGITYEVTNQKGVKSYLIGTNHFVDKESVQDPAIMEIIGKCSALYSEFGINLFITSAHGSMPEGDHQYWDIPLRYKYDTAITLAAWCKKIPITSLDEGVPYRDAQQAEGRKTLEKCGVDEIERLFMEQASMFSRDPDLLLSLQQWKNGDIQSFKQDRYNDDDGLNYRRITQREEHWVKTLIPKLLETEQSIAIAVGASHVVGDNSLSERFAKSGLKVELISPRPLSLWARLSTIMRKKEAHPITPTPHSRL
jgi:hypothetical protein